MTARWQSNSNRVVREQHPLQQGLRHIHNRLEELACLIVREQHPLQQGLRP